MASVANVVRQFGSTAAARGFGGASKESIWEATIAEANQNLASSGTSVKSSGISTGMGMVSIVNASGYVIEHDSYPISAVKIIRGNTEEGTIHVDWWKSAAQVESAVEDLLNAKDRAVYQDIARGRIKDAR